MNVVWCAGDNTGDMSLARAESHKMENEWKTKKGKSISHHEHQMRGGELLPDNLPTIFGFW